MNQIVLVLSVFILSVPAMAQEIKPSVDPKKPKATTAAPSEAAPPADVVSEAPPVIPVETKKVEAKPKKEEEEERYGKTHGIAGPVTFGPSISILGFPHPLEAALEAKYLDVISMQFTYGFIPQFTVSSVKAKMNALDARVRWHPFRGAFYLGGAFYGKQTVNVTKSQDITVSGVKTAVTVNGELKSDFLTPMMGWRWQWHSGFFFGLDLGWQLNRNATTTITTDAPAALQTQADYVTLKSDVEKKGNDYGNKALPSFTLLHIGFMF